MNKIAFGCAVLAIVLTATWAYHVNYRTAQALDRVQDLRAQIAAEREALQVLKVEWAYMNSPTRLQRLVKSQNDRLALAPMTPEVFGHVAGLPFPAKNETEALDRLIAQVLAQSFTFGQPVAPEPELPPEASALQTGLDEALTPIPSAKPKYGWAE